MSELDVLMIPHTSVSLQPALFGQRISGICHVAMLSYPCCSPNDVHLNVFCSAFRQYQRWMLPSGPSQDALTVLLLAYGYAKPQQTLLAEQMFEPWRCVAIDQESTLLSRLKLRMVHHG